ncbi:MAG TPA: hypothetical protein DD379_23415 [Cyanobacteria bacterium UBA11162]|nr:hypothetical protein [Cyanobacteria bacterium UBA11162]
MFKSNLLPLFQGFLGFLKQILITRWRSLLTLLIGVYLPLQIFEELAVVIAKNEGSFPWDEPIMLAIHQTAQPQLDVFAATFTQLGIYWGVAPIATMIGLILLRQQQWRSLAYLVTTLLGSTLINRTAKVLLHRVRPHLWESFYPPAPDYAFPSGHAMSSMTLVAALVILTWGSRWCWTVLIFGSLFVLGIGWTRLYLGVHYPSDILAGWLVAVAWVIGVSLLIQPHLPKAISAVNEETLNTTANI